MERIKFFDAYSKFIILLLQRLYLFLQSRLLTISLFKEMLKSTFGLAIFLILTSLNEFFAAMLATHCFLLYCMFHLAYSMSLHSYINTFARVRQLVYQHVYYVKYKHVQTRRMLKDGLS